MSKNKSNANRGRNSQNRNTNKSGRNCKYKRPVKKEDLQSEDKVNSVNDSSWYTQYPELIRDSAALNFNEIMGKKIKTASATMKTGEVIDTSFVSPGIMTLDIIPMYGRSEDNTSALNQAAQALYSWVRHANAGAKNYEAPDLMMYCMAMSEVYAYINFLQRIYGFALSYNVINRYTPDALLFSNYVDSTSFNSDTQLAEFRYGVNRLINKASVFAVPASLPIFQRHAFLYQNVYTEGLSAREQMYMLVPAGFHKYVETQGPGKLEYVVFNNRVHTLSELLEFGNMLLDALMLSEDIGTMSGDIIKAYGTDLIKLTPLGLEYDVPILFDVPMLEQIRNATIVGNVRDSDITQNPTTGALISTPSSTDERFNTFSKGRQIINTVNPAPDNVYVTEITRLKSAVTDEGKLAFCSEIVSKAHIVTKVGSGNSRVGFGGYTTPRVVIDGTDPNWHSFMDELVSELKIQALRCHFDYSPMQYMYLFADVININSSNDLTTYRGIGYISDLDNYATIDVSELDNIHDACIASMFVSPLVKKYSK